jgi:hypothetical protein
MRPSPLAATLAERRREQLANWLALLALLALGIVWPVLT